LVPTAVLSFKKTFVGIKADVTCNNTCLRMGVMMSYLTMIDQSWHYIWIEYHYGVAFTGSFANRCKKTLFWLIFCLKW
jgi:hypothetical protein